MRARLSGVPTWLLKLFSLAWVGPWRASTWRSISLVPVLPTLPVTAAMRAAVRDRAARARSSRPRAVSATSSSGEPVATPWGRWSTMAAAAPFSMAWPTKPWPSVAAPFSATKRSPSTTCRLSKATPLACQGMVASPPVASAASSWVHRMSLMRHLPIWATRLAHLVGIVEGQDLGRRRSGRARDPCRRPPARRPRRARRQRCGSRAPVADLDRAAGSRPCLARGSRRDPRCAGCRR